MSKGLVVEKLKAPFPYFGGKSRWVDTVWSYLGKPDVYVEPFAGTAIMLLQSPQVHKREVICDLNGFICNAYRAIKHDPEATAHWADYPTIHQDLTARHKWLIAWGKEHSAKLSGDPEWYDAKAAGWWVWGASNWIGKGWCKDHTDEIPKSLPHPGGTGISQQRISLGQIPASKDIIGGTGVSAQTRDRKISILDWFLLLSQRLKNVIVFNRGWKSGVSKTVLCDHTNSPYAERYIYTQAIFLDPPYRLDKRTKGLYPNDTTTDPSEESYLWAIEHGERYRIAYCMQWGDYPVPDGWTPEIQTFGGYGKDRTKRDCIIFSPACVGQRTLF